MDETSDHVISREFVSARPCQPMHPLEGGGVAFGPHQFQLAQPPAPSGDYWLH